MRVFQEDVRCFLNKDVFHQRKICLRPIIIARGSCLGNRHLAGRITNITSNYQVMTECVFIPPVPFGAGGRLVKRT